MRFYLLFNLFSSDTLFSPIFGGAPYIYSESHGLRSPKTGPRIQNLEASLVRDMGTHQAALGSCHYKVLPIYARGLLQTHFLVIIPSPDKQLHKIRRFTGVKPLPVIGCGEEQEESSVYSTIFGGTAKPKEYRAAWLLCGAGVTGSCIIMSWMCRSLGVFRQ